jgi:RNA polymerase sigma factor (sigma-70 family)
VPAFPASYTGRMASPAAPDPDPADPAPSTAVLVENHRAFLRYLERRLGDRTLAEDILQDAFVRHLGHRDDVPDEALVPWFYRVLRNALIDRLRKETTEGKALAALAHELDAQAAPEAAVRAEVCACIARLSAAMKPEYRDAIQAVDVDERPVKAFADAAGLTASNAGVRLFRARAALKRRVLESCGTCAEHGCRDCSCGASAGAAEVWPASDGCNETAASPSKG